MSDEDIKRLEQDILEEYVVLPCGCVLHAETTYPGQPWTYLSTCRSYCGEHLPTYKPAEGTIVFLSHRSILEFSWFGPDQTKVSQQQLQEAMKFWLRGQPQIGPEKPLPDVWAMGESSIPHILSQDGKFAIRSTGEICAVPGRLSLKYKPGDLVREARVSHTGQSYIAFVNQKNAQEEADHLKLMRIWSEVIQPLTKLTRRNDVLSHTGVEDVTFGGLDFVKMIVLQPSRALMDAPRSDEVEVPEYEHLLDKQTVGRVCRLRPLTIKTPKKTDE
jgi:hypothetical protein